jgi:hypothetical protein
MSLMDSPVLLDATERSSSWKSCGIDMCGFTMMLLPLLLLLLLAPPPGAGLGKVDEGARNRFSAASNTVRVAGSRPDGHS